MLRPFQKKFLQAAIAPDIDTAALSVPRGNGKSWLAGYLAASALKQIRPGQEVVLCAASIEQARIVFRFVRSMLGEKTGFSYTDSANRISITRNDGAKLRVIGSNGKTAMGLVNTPIVIADEPGSWEAIGGGLMHDAIQTAQGKPGSQLRAVYIGTLAPAHDGWWHDLIADGSHGSTYVQALQADREKWDKWPEIRRCNPLTAISPEFRKKLLEERDEARRDSRLKARFLSYRMNVPSADESEVLLSVDDFKRMAQRPTPERMGRPIVGIDLGGGRAWSAGVAVWENGRIEALALAPGIPSLAEQEARDRMSKGAYEKLADAGLLEVAEGLRVQPPALLWAMIQEAWGQPAQVVCDRFRLAELQDVVGLGVPSDAAADIRSLRKGALDGPLSVAPSSASLLAASLAVSRVKNDDQGNVRLVKRGTNNEARDDVAAALVLASGAWEREASRPKPSPGMAVVTG